VSGDELNIFGTCQCQHLVSNVDSSVMLASIQSILSPHSKELVHDGREERGRKRAGNIGLEIQCEPMSSDLLPILLSRKWILQCGRQGSDTQLALFSRDFACSFSRRKSRRKCRPPIGCRHLHLCCPPSPGFHFLLFFFNISSHATYTAVALVSNHHRYRNPQFNSRQPPKCRNERF
jgi:hypothetical protein